MNQPPKQYPLLFRLRRFAYLLCEGFKRWMCSQFGHKPGMWVEGIKPMPWQVKRGLKIPKRMAICQRCAKQIQEF